MTPKERAKHLIDTYLNLPRLFNQISDENDAKHCALVAAKETLYAIESLYDDCIFDTDSYKSPNGVSARKYWKEVINELKN
jgi:hypothetical protein